MTPEQKEIRRLKILGGVVVLVFCGGFAAWGSLFQLSGAVAASGRFVAQSDVKKVQHPQGGVIAKMEVQEGALVQEGQLLIRLDDTQTRAELAIIDNQIDQLSARMARLLAERDGAERIDYSAELLARAKDDALLATAIADESHLFDARRSSLASQRRQLSERTAQLSSEIAGLVAQRAAAEDQISLLKSEQASVKPLYAKGLVDISRVNTLLRQTSSLEGERGRLIAEAARSAGEKVELEYKLDQTNDDMRSEAGTSLRDTQDKLSELGQRQTAAKDRLARIDIRAPQTGYIHQLQFHAAGEVVDAGAVLMLIIPVDDPLLVEAAVQPKDIDEVHVGDAVVVRVMAGNYRATAELDAKVALVAADTTTNQQAGTSFYTVRVALDPDQAAKLGDMRLVPGMPAETFIKTGSRTPIEYLVKPLVDQIWHTWRER
jgi:HlyD family secretion protein